MNPTTIALHPRALGAAIWFASCLVAFGSAAQAVVDGDTIKINGQRIRLHGIDAPETRQVCADNWTAGREARAALAKLMAGGSPECTAVTTDRYGRTVATCRVKGFDIGSEMVKQGMAWAYLRYSWRYLPEEVLARFKGVGVHGHDCQKPADWRAEQQTNRKR